MPPAVILALAQAVLQAAPGLISEVQTLANKGEVSPEQQAALLKAYGDLKAAVAAGPFQGPEWQVS